MTKLTAKKPVQLTEKTYQSQGDGRSLGNNGLWPFTLAPLL